MSITHGRTIKEDYGFNKCSAAAGQLGNENHVEKYGEHLVAFARRWGFDYHNPIRSFENVRGRYSGTLVERYFDHDCRNGPLKVFKIRH